jgi:Domain of unknown function (DUF397)
MSADHRTSSWRTQGWRRSSCCINAGCVEIRVVGDAVLVRDSKDDRGLVLSYTREEWAAFVEGVKAGEFDVDSA